MDGGEDEGVGSHGVAGGGGVVKWVIRWLGLLRLVW